jgi:hypothetical protein
LESLTAEQREVYDGLPGRLRASIYRVLEREVPAGRTDKTRDAFERILKTEGIASVVSREDAIDRARDAYTKGKVVALSA